MRAHFLAVPTVGFWIMRRHGSKGTQPTVNLDQPKNKRRFRRLNLKNSGARFRWPGMLERTATPSFSFPPLSPPDPAMVGWGPFSRSPRRSVRHRTEASTTRRTGSISGRRLSHSPSMAGIRPTSDRRLRRVRAPRPGAGRSRRSSARSQPRGRTTANWAAVLHFRIRAPSGFIARPTSAG